MLRKGMLLCKGIMLRQGMMLRLGKTNRAGSVQFARTSSELENLSSVRTSLTELRSCLVRALPILTEPRSCSVRDARDARDVAYKNTILEALNLFCMLPTARQGNIAK